MQKFLKYNFFYSEKAQLYNSNYLLLPCLTAPAVSDVGQAITNTLQRNEVTFIQVTLPDWGMTLSIDVTVGVVVTYGSNKIQNPNEAFYDFKLSNSKPEIFVTTDTFGIANFTNITVYISIQGQSASNEIDTISAFCM